MKYCPQCGEEFKEDFNYCGMCGAKLMMSVEDDYKCRDTDAFTDAQKIEAFDKMYDMAWNTYELVQDAYQCCEKGTIDTEFYFEQVMQLLTLGQTEEENDYMWECLNKYASDNESKYLYT